MPYKAIRAISYGAGSSVKVVRKDRQISHAEYLEVPENQKQFFEEVTDVKTRNTPDRAVRVVSETTKVRETVNTSTEAIQVKPPTVEPESQGTSTYPQNVDIKIN